MSLFTKPTRRIPGSMTAYLQPAQRYMRCHRAGSAPGGISGGVNRPSADLRPAGLTASSDRKQREQMTARQPILKLVIQTYSLSLSLFLLFSPHLSSLSCSLHPSVHFHPLGSVSYRLVLRWTAPPLHHHLVSLWIIISDPWLSPYLILDSH